MKILIIQHSAADRPATVAEVLDRSGHVVETIRLDRNEAIPTAITADAMMTFGGGMSLTSEGLPPWVAQEQELIRAYVNEGRKVFGICLGSQILASALGARVQRNVRPEIGWHEIERVAGSGSSRLAKLIPDRLRVLQWHQDTFGIPAGAQHLFRSDACENQAFAIDDRVFGFQFHMEADPKTVSTFLAVSEAWKQTGPSIQSESEIMAGIDAYMPQQSHVLGEFLDAYLHA